jgi:16S rRNA (uracil1498-N3)-methyltransferase
VQLKNEGSIKATDAKRVGQESMRRFFVEQIERNSDNSCVISGTEARHILKVLRMTKGDEFILMDRSGDRYETVIESIDGSTVLIKLLRPLPGPALPDLEITLCQALLKSGPMDYLIEKTSELGVAYIKPFASERTVVKIAGEVESNKLRRWREIAVSAAKQSDRTAPAEISQPFSFADIMGQLQDADCLKVILWEREESRDLKEVLGTSAPGPRFVGMIGPEGGFSMGEVNEAREAGFIPVSLGKRILRAETAAITLTALVQYEWGDLSIRSSH